MRWFRRKPAEPEVTHLCVDCVYYEDTGGLWSEDECYATIARNYVTGQMTAGKALCVDRNRDGLCKLFQASEGEI